MRRGKDGIDGTADDHVFLKTFEIAADINAVIPLTLDEAQAIDALNMKGLLTTNSFYYTIEATGKLASRSDDQDQCVRFIHPGMIKLYIGKRDKIFVFLMVMLKKMVIINLNIIGSIQCLVQIKNI